DRGVLMRSRLACGALPLLLLSWTSTVGADPSSGTWTGEVEARGNYYWETSTRVVAPEVRARIESPEGTRVRGRYLLDAITSASVAAGAITDVGFTEVRHDATLGVGREFDLGDVQLDLDLSGRMSFEPDYRSTSGTLLSSLWLFQRATQLSLGGTVLHDDIRGLLRSGNTTTNIGEVGTLNSVVLNAGVHQILTPIMSLGLGYDLGILSGYLSNPYRSVSLGMAPVAERHPSDRLRHTLHARYAVHLAPTRTSLHAILRGYVDSWDILAITPEARVYQEIEGALLLRLSYRYYAQSKAFFQQSTYAPTDPFYTADPKMTAFDAHQVGARAEIPLVFLGKSALDFAAGASLDFSFEFLWRDNAFGNAVIAQSGIVAPF
ncbi:MAG: DUF3570 domain-containing protein, partial [Myxococcales bacterium]|nr:DUF3570 domain-containing protein [Myxococcales bacterium]